MEVSKVLTSAELAEWEDPDVQIAYNLLCDSEAPPNTEEHWEGYIARRIVGELRKRSAHPIVILSSPPGELDLTRARRELATDPDPS